MSKCIHLGFFSFYYLSSISIYKGSDGHYFLLADHTISVMIVLCYRAKLTLSRFSSVAQSCLTLRDPMNCSMPGFQVDHQLMELAQTHVHQVSDAIQPSHPLSPPSPLTLGVAIDNTQANGHGYIPKIFHVQNQEAG